MDILNGIKMRKSKRLCVNTITVNALHITILARKER